MNDLKQVKEEHINILAPQIADVVFAQIKAYVTCTATLDGDQVPSPSSSNGFLYPPSPTHLPPFDCISKRLVDTRLPFMQIRRLRHHMGGCVIVGQVINIPVHVNNMVMTPPKQLNEL
jgi:hypothetical protein